MTQVELFPTTYARYTLQGAAGNLQNHIEVTTK